MDMIRPDMKQRQHQWLTLAGVSKTEGWAMRIQSRP
jgi:hypothetical protein